MNEPTLGQEDWGWGRWGVHQAPYCMSKPMRNLNNKPCHRQKLQPFSSIGPSYGHSNFISPQWKIEAGGINSRYIPNISPAIWAALGGLYFIFCTGGANNLLEMYYIRSKRKDKIGHGIERQKQAKSELFNFAVTRSGVMRWLSLSILQVQYHSKCKKEEWNVIRPLWSLDLLPSTHLCIVLIVI